MVGVSASLEAWSGYSSAIATPTLIEGSCERMGGVQYRRGGCGPDGSYPRHQMRTNHYYHWSRDHWRDLNGNNDH